MSIGQKTIGDKWSTDKWPILAWFWKYHCWLWKTDTSTRYKACWKTCITCRRMKCDRNRAKVKDFEFFFKDTKFALFEIHIKNKQRTLQGNSWRRDIWWKDRVVQCYKTQWMKTMGMKSRKDNWISLNVWTKANDEKIDIHPKAIVIFENIYIFKDKISIV